MKIVVISAYPMVRKGIISIISNQPDIQFVGEASTVQEATKLIEETGPGIVLSDAILNEGTGLDLFLDLKLKGISTRFIIMGIHGDKDFVINSLKEGVEGYILREAHPSEIIYAVRQVHRGKEYVDTDILKLLYADEMMEEVPKLTTREKEILIALGEGMSNRQIAKSLFITEHTVKKHVSQVLLKLEFQDRTQAAIYANNIGLIS